MLAFIFSFFLQLACATGTAVALTFYLTVAALMLLLIQVPAQALEKYRGPWQALCSAR